MQKKLLGLFALLFFFSFPISILGAQTQINEFTPNELIILYPKIDYAQQGELLKLHFHILNGSGYLVIPSNTTSCYIHIYDNKGNHIVESTLSHDSNAEDYVYNFIQTSQVGHYPYNVWCNNSKEAGYLSTSFEITQSGEENNPFISWLVFGGSLFVIIIMLGFVHIFKKDEGSSMVYGSIALVISVLIIYGLNIGMFGNIITGFWRFIVFLLLAVVALYSFAISWAFYHDVKQNKQRD